MRALLTALFLFSFAAASGLGATWLVATGHAVFGTLTIGAWSARPTIGTSEIDPYARAEIARSGELVLGSSEGLTFMARYTDAGAPLDGRCDVTVAGPVPPARFWTVTLYDPAGHIVANDVGRHGFTSLEVLRRADGSFSVTIAPRARAGNWLPSGGIERYVLAFRLFDTTVGSAVHGLQRDAPTMMPAITMGTCP